MDSFPICMKQNAGLGLVMIQQECSYVQRCRHSCPKGLELVWILDDILSQNQHQAITHMSTHNVHTSWLLSSFPSEFGLVSLGLDPKRCTASTPAVCVIQVLAERLAPVGIGPQHQKDELVEHRVVSIPAGQWEGFSRQKGGKKAGRRQN